MPYPEELGQPERADTPELQMSPEAFDLLSRIALARDIGVNTNGYRSLPFQDSLSHLHDTVQSVLIDKSDDEHITSVVDEVISRNTLDGESIPEPLGKMRDADAGIIDKQRQLLKIYQEDPETAQVLVAENISGFHAANSGGLLSVLKHGLLSAADARDQQGIVITGGERMAYMSDGPRKTVSFADWKDPGSIRSYARIDFDTPQTKRSLRKEARRLGKVASNAPEYLSETAQILADDAQAVYKKVKTNEDPLETELILANFPVAYGIDVEDITVRAATRGAKDSGLHHIVDSDIEGEFMTRSSVSSEDIKVIAVPKEHIARVNEVISQRSPDSGVKIVPLESILHGSQPVMRPPWEQWF